MKFHGTLAVYLFLKANREAAGPTPSLSNPPSSLSSEPEPEPGTYDQVSLKDQENKKVSPCLGLWLGVSSVLGRHGLTLHGGAAVRAETERTAFLGQRLSLALDEGQTPFSLVGA